MEIVELTRLRWSRIASYVVAVPSTPARLGRAGRSREGNADVRVLRIEPGGADRGNGTNRVGSAPHPGGRCGLGAGGRRAAPPRRGWPGRLLRARGFARQRERRRDDCGDGPGGRSRPRRRALAFGSDRWVPAPSLDQAGFGATTSPVIRIGAEASGSADGHTSARGHQLHHRPGVSTGSRPARNDEAARAVAITRSAAWNDGAPSCTSSACQVPPFEEARGDAGQGGTPKRSVCNNA